MSATSAWEIWAAIAVNRVICLEECKKGSREIGNATAFFYQHAQGSYLITNKHVVFDEKSNHFPDTLELKLHTDRHKQDLTLKEDYAIPLYSRDGEKNWIEHTSIDQADIVATQLDCREIGERLWTNAFKIENQILKEPPISMCEPLFVLGYPLGFYDKINNLPISRSATIASLFSVPFEGNPFILIDSHLHAGSSGSPVLTTPNTLRLIDGNLFVQTYRAPFLVGIFSGVVPDRDAITNDHLGLGVVWESRLIPEIITQRSD